MRTRKKKLYHRDAESAEKKVLLMKKYSELCELCASAVKKNLLALLRTVI